MYSADARATGPFDCAQDRRSPLHFGWISLGETHSRSEASLSIVQQELREIICDLIVAVLGFRGIGFRCFRNDAEFPARVCTRVNYRLSVTAEGTQINRLMIFHFSPVAESLPSA